MYYISWLEFDLQYIFNCSISSQYQMLEMKAEICQMSQSAPKISAGSSGDFNAKPCRLSSAAHAQYQFFWFSIPVFFICTIIYFDKSKQSFTDTLQIMMIVLFDSFFGEFCQLLFQLNQTSEKNILQLNVLSCFTNIFVATKKRLKCLSQLRCQNN